MLFRSSLQSGRKHQAKGMPADESDWRPFLRGMRGRPSEAWWRANLNLSAYYSFHSLNRLFGNVDLREEANHGFYHAPDGRWAPIPWDNDMMFIPHSHQSGVTLANRCLESPRLNREFKNRAREILDLFASDPAPNGGQFAQLVAEYARILCPPGETRTWPELDMAVWNYHPRSHARGVFYLNPYTMGWTGVPFRRVLATPDFAGFCRYIVGFCTDSRPVKNYRPDDNNPVGHGWGHLDWEARDAAIPERPVVQGQGQGTSIKNGWAFRVTPFASPLRGVSFAAIQWRAARIAAPGLAGYRAGEPWVSELTPVWESPEIADATPEFSLPAEVCQPGQTYRVRARYRDSQGRWSHWSAPVQFVSETVASRK